MSSLATRIASSTFSQVSSKIIVALLSIISVKLITTYLGAEGYGKYTVIYELMSFAGIVANFGFFHIALREMGKNKNDMPRILANILSMRLVLALIASVITFLFVYYGTNYEYETVKIGLIIALGTITIGLIGTTITAVIQVHLKMVMAAAIQVIGKIAMIVYIIFTIRMDLGFLHMLYAGFFGSIIIMLLTYFYTTRFSRIYFAFDWQFCKDLIKQTFPMGLGLIFYTIALRSPIIVMDAILGDASLTGQYGVAQRIVEVLIFIPIAFMNSVLPSLSAFLHTNTKESKNKVRSLIQHSFDFLNILSIPLILGGIVFAPEIIALISKAEFTKSIIILQILLGMIFFYYMSTLFGYILLAHHKQYLYMKANIFSAITALGLGILATPYFREYGALSAHIFAEVVAAVVCFWYVTKVISVTLSFRYFWRIIMAGLIMFVVVSFVREYIIQFHAVVTVIIGAFIGGVTYFVILFMIKGIPLQEIKSIFSKRL